MAAGCSVAALLAALLVGPASAIDNGLGRTPPMGWRSWNCYGGNVNQSKMTATMDRMAARTRTVGGKPTSLLDLGVRNLAPRLPPRPTAARLTAPGVRTVQQRRARRQLAEVRLAERPAFLSRGTPSAWTKPSAAHTIVPV